MQNSDEIQVCGQELSVQLDDELCNFPFMHGQEATDDQVMLLTEHGNIKELVVLACKEAMLSRGVAKNVVKNLKAVDALPEHLPDRSIRFIWRLTTNFSEKVRTTFP